jgi:poly-gamma-glutamate capsule biosynthesis protein CapA/YwtB (metallophosphatase superfamily)
MREKDDNGVDTGFIKFAAATKNLKLIEQRNNMKKIISFGMGALALFFMSGCSGQFGGEAVSAAEKQGNVAAYAQIPPPSKIPDPSVSTVPSSAPEIKHATVAAVGDVMLMAAQINDAKTGDSFDFNPVFDLIGPYIEEADISIANLETPVAGNDMGYSVSGELKEDGTRAFSYFNAPVEILDALKNAGFDVLCTANNHALDKNRDGVENTIKYIRAAGLDCVGTNLPGEERNAIIKEVNGITFAFLAYTNSVNGNSGGYTGDELYQAVNFINEDNIKADIKAVKQEGADIVALCLHTGEERKTVPTSSQVEWAKEFVAAGADIIFYSHAHVLQPMEMVTAGEGTEARTGFVAYCLGNFISNMDGDDCARAVVTYVDVMKDENGAKIEGVRYLPTYFYRGGNYKVLPINPGSIDSIRREMGDSVAQTAMGAYTRTVDFLSELAAVPEQ